MAGNAGFRKTVNKAKSWWKHGKHKGAIEHALRENRQREEEATLRRARTQMYPTVAEAFASEKRKR